MSIEPILTKLIAVGLSEIVKLSIKKIVDLPWKKGTDNGKHLIRQLDDETLREKYISKYVLNILKMRTLHSAESDVLLDDIYSPSKIISSTTQDEIKIEDNVVITYKGIINIVGIAGQGKSTIIKKLFIEEIKKQQRFPILIELRKIKENDILGSINDIFRNIGFQIVDGDIEYLLQSNKCVLMLDGFDELPSSQRGIILQKITQINIRYNCPIISTSRPDTEICREPGITNFRVKSLKTSDVLNILHKICSSAEIETLSKLVNDNSHLRKTLTTPILVNLLYVCYPYLDFVPRNGIDFYEKLFITLYSRHDKMKNFSREKDSNLDKVAALNCFSAFCFISLKESKFDFTFKILEKLIRKALKASQLDECEAENYINDVKNITCLIQEEGFDRYVFLHKSVQEYHAAKFISELPHHKKEQFYNKLSNYIDSSDSFDNVLLFLKKIDHDDYQRSLILYKMENLKFNQISSNEKKVCLELVNNMLNNKLCKFSSLTTSEKVTFVSFEKIDSNTFISSLPFILNGVRDKSEYFDEYISEFIDSKFSKDEIQKIAFEKLPKNRKHQVEEYFVSTNDFLVMLDKLDDFIKFISKDINKFHEMLYIPLKLELKNRDLGLEEELNFDF